VSFDVCGKETTCRRYDRECKKGSGHSEQGGAGKNGTSNESAYRIKAPRCTTLTDDFLEPFNTDAGFAIIDDEGFQNTLFTGEFGPNIQDADWGSKEDALARFPTFEKFRMIDPVNTPSQSPVIE
jgi:hypothetical protein